jgi:hypothetical protein
MKKNYADGYSTCSFQESLGSLVPRPGLARWRCSLNFSCFVIGLLLDGFDLSQDFVEHGVLDRG